MVKNNFFGKNAQQNFFCFGYHFDDVNKTSKNAQKDAKKVVDVAKIFYSFAREKFKIILYCS